MRWHYARALYSDGDATLDDLREAVTTLEDAGRIARRVLGGAHPLTMDFADHLRYARAALRAREEASSLHEAVTTLEKSSRTTRRALGGAHPITMNIEANLRAARAALRARETPSGSA